MNVIQSIQQPLGVKVFGSAVILVSPNVATLSFSVSHQADHPREAFHVTHEAVGRVREFLTVSADFVDEVSMSRISLAEAYQYKGGEQQFVGYKASVEFNILLRRLDELEKLVIGLVDEGVNRILGISYTTTELKTLRAEARRRAVKAAHEKAQLYCNEAKVGLGAVVYIEDINPDQLRGHEGHTAREVITDDDGSAKAFDPGSITVNGAVMVTFQIIQPEHHT